MQRTDNVAPRPVLSLSPSQTALSNQDPVLIRVDFGEDLHASTPFNIARVTLGGTCPGKALSTVTAVSGNRVFDVVITGMSGAGTIHLDVAASQVTLRLLCLFPLRCAPLEAVLGRIALTRFVPAAVR